MGSRTLTPDFDMASPSVATEPLQVGHAPPVTFLLGVARHGLIQGLALET